MEYYIVAVIDGTRYYYHSDKKFYWNFWYINQCTFKTWKTLKAAKRTFNRLRFKYKVESLMLMGIGPINGNYVTDGVLVEKREL